MLSAGQETAKKENTVTAPSHCAAVPRRNRLVRFLALIGLVNLSFLGGAAVMFLSFRPHPFSVRHSSAAQHGTRCDRRRNRGFRSIIHSLLRAELTSRTRRATGSLYACMAEVHGPYWSTCAADVVHHWHVPFSKLWTNPPHLHGPFNDATNLL